MPRPKISPSKVEAAFWKRVRKTETCWLWMGKKNEKGYGIFYTPDNPNLRAHHYSWMLHGNGEVPEGLLLRHSCDTPSCVNPKHLLLGLPEDNSFDMVSRGRSARGERHSQAVLSDAEVLEIRRMFCEGARQSALVVLFKSSSATISRICNGRTRTC